MTSRAPAAWKTLSSPSIIGGRRFPAIGLVVLTTIGTVLLLVVATTRWGEGADQHAYWLAARRLIDGLPLYDPTATSVTPYAYWYPPPLAQVLVPVAAVIPARAFDLLWIALLLVCLVWMAGWRPLVALAFVAYIAVAAELWFANVHLILAALIVLGLRRWPWAFAIGAAIKIAPGLGILYLVLRRRWRDASRATAVGLVILLISVLIGPSAWSQFIQILEGRGPADISGLLPIPYFVRFAVGVVLTVVAALIRPRIGEPLLVVAITLALPTLWLNALSTLIAIVPIVIFGSQSTSAGLSDSGRVAPQAG